MYTHLLAGGLVLTSTLTFAQVAPIPAPSPRDAVPPVTSSEPVSALVSQVNGKIVMYRGGTIMGAGVACPIRYKGQELVELARGKFAEWEVPAGRYVLNNKSSSVEVTVEAGKPSFVRCAIKTGFWVGSAELQIRDEASFSEHAAELKQKTVNAVSK